MSFRALIFSKVTEAHGPGGMQRHLSWLIRWLAEAGAEITLVTTTGGCLEAGLPVSGYTIPGTEPGRYSRAWWLGTRALARDLPLGAWDVLLSEDGGAWAVIDEVRARSTRPPIVMFRHGTTLLNLRQNLPPRQPRALLSAAVALRDYWRHPRRLARYVDVMVVPSDRIAASARSEGAGPETDVRFIPLGVDLTVYSPVVDPRPARRALGLEPERPTLAWVGRDVSGKRVEMALAVFQRLQEIGAPHQLIVAAASPRRSTREMIDRLRRTSGPSIVLVADAPLDDMRLVYAAADLELFPSVLPEGIPFAILEALACGVPVLAAANPSLTDLRVFQEQPSWLVQDASPGAWAERVRALTHQSELVPARRAARVLAERHHDLRLTAAGTVQAVLDAIARRPPMDPR